MCNDDKSIKGVSQLKKLNIYYLYLKDCSKFNRYFKIKCIISSDKETKLFLYLDLHISY